MLTTMRNRLGPAAVTLIIGGIAGVFVLSDFIAPRAARSLNQMSGSGVAGEVNGESISMSEFNRELSRRIESMKQMTGGKLTDEQLKMFRIHEGVFNELVQRKLILQDCAKSGLLPADAEVRSKIQELPYFQKDGRFDMAAYKGVLAGNSLTPAGFEKMIRDDLTLQRWMDSVKARVQVSDDEVEREFRVLGDKRNIKYVLLDIDTGRKAVEVPASEVAAFIKDAPKLARARARFDQLKDTAYKGRKFEDVQGELARDVLAGEKTEAILKANQKLADAVLPLLGSAPDAAVNALLKPTGGSVKTTGLVTRQSNFVAGLGEAGAILSDAFADRSPIDRSQGGKAKKYETPAGITVAVVTESKKPDMGKLAGERSKLSEQIRMRKERALEEEWVQQLKAKARIVMDPAINSQGA